MITISAFPWVPPFAQGNVRDLRVRWALEELGLPYEVRLVRRRDQKSDEYRALQPFGQVPIFDEDGHGLFESAAIVLHLADRNDVLIPSGQRDQVVQWCFAALNSIEPFFMNLAEIDFFFTDATWAKDRRPVVLEQIRGRLAELATALGDRETLLDRFSAADLLMTTVLRILKQTELLQEHPTLAAYRARHEARPAFARALEAQLATFAENEPKR